MQDDNQNTISSTTPAGSNPMGGLNPPVQPVQTPTPPTTPTSPTPVSTPPPSTPIGVVGKEGKNKGLFLVAVILMFLIVLLVVLYYVIIKQSYQANETTTIKTNNTRVSQPSPTPATSEEGDVEKIVIEDPAQELNQIDQDLNSL